MEKLLKEVREMNTRFQSQESVADGLLKKCLEVQQKIQTLHQCEDGFNELNKASGRRSAIELLHGSKHESERIRTMEEENRELRMSLREHQETLELLMTKYREQIASLTTANRMDRSCVNLLNTALEQELAAKDEKILEMAGIMEQAIVVDEESLTRDGEMVGKVCDENRRLRELLHLTSFDDVSEEEEPLDMKSHVLKHIPPPEVTEDEKTAAEEEIEER